MESVSSVQDWWHNQRFFGNLLSLVDLGYENADVVDASIASVHTASNASGDRINVLVPPFDSPARKLSVRSATAIMVAIVCTDATAWQTISQAMETCGVFWTTAALLLGAVWSDRALQLLCASVRRSGVISYAEVAWIAFSYRAELGVASLLHIYLVILMVEHLFTIGGLIESIQNTMWQIIVSASPSPTTSSFSNAIILFIILVATATPLLAIRDLYALRTLSFFSLACLVTLMTLLYLLLLFESLLGGKYPHEDVIDDKIEHSGGRNEWSESQNDTSTMSKTALIVVSTVIQLVKTMLVYTPSFVLILPIHAPLNEPTNARVVQVIRRGMGWTFLILWSMALSLQIMHKWSSSQTSSAVGTLQFLAQVFPNDTVALCLATLIQILAAAAILLAALVLLQPCRSQILECIQRHYMNEGSHEQGCCCDGSNIPCEALHQNCPEECLKEDAETEQETVPSFTSQSITLRINNNAFIPVVSSAPAAVNYFEPEHNPPPVQIGVSRSNTIASEITPLVMSATSSQSPSYIGSRDSFYGMTSCENVNNTTGLTSSDDAQRPVKIRRQPYKMLDDENDEEANGGSTPNRNGGQPCNIDSNRLIRVSSGAIIWLFAYLTAVFCFGTILSAATFTKEVIAVLISYVFPVACFVKLHPRRRRR